MSKDAIQEYDATTASNNSDIGGINVAESCPFANLNNALRELARQVKSAVANQGTDIASATTTDIGAATGQYVKVTGTTTITGLGTVAAGTMRWVEWGGALTLTHNATSLKLPGSANITTVAGDVGLFVSLGSGNWKCLHYSRADGSPISLGSSITAISADAGASGAPDLILDRNSASPAISDEMGQIKFRGRDSGGNSTDYATILSLIVDTADGSEDGRLAFQTLAGGTNRIALDIQNGVQVGSPTGGDKGAGTLNVDGDIYKDGVKISSGTGILLGSATSTTADSTTTTIPYDNTKPQSTEGKEHLTVTVTPNSASSTLEIEVLAMVGINSTGQVTGAIFQDSGADALYVVSTTASTNLTNLLHIKFVVSAASTTARTYKFRYGPDANTAYINRDPAGSKFGGVLTSTMTVKEYLP